MVRIHPAVSLDDDEWHDLPAIHPMNPACLNIMAENMAEPFRLRFRFGEGWGPAIDIPRGYPFAVPGPNYGVFAQAQRVEGNTAIRVIETTNHLI